MKTKNIFNDIISGKIPADIVYQDDLLTAFRDIKPKAPIHILIVPNELIPTCNEVTENNEKLLGHIFTVAAKIARQEGIDKKGYRLIMNCNDHAGQEIYHIHMHLLGGCPLGPMLDLTNKKA
ncbi:HIT domain-containing protein [Candidatus Ishikawella capsulata]|nr:HIT domain-containing protein [Candidatus Ishikawaella capsulata]